MGRYTTVHTDLGTLAIGFSDHGVTRILLPVTDFGDLSRPQLFRAGLRTKARETRAIARLTAALRAHVAGDVQDFTEVTLDTDGMAPFFLHTLRAAQRIPPGRTRTYAELAALAGSPRAARAVGQAMATNPWPIVVPCHRVVASNGFGQYSAGGGVQTKLRLLWREGYRGRTSNVPFDEHAATAHLAAADPAMAKLIERVGPFTLQAAAPHAMRALSDEEIVVRFTRTRGISRWNAKMLLIYYLGRPDVLPATDPMLRKGFALTYRTRGLPNAKAVTERARAWSPYASVATWYLWRAVDIDRRRRHHDGRA